MDRKQEETEQFNKEVEEYRKRLGLSQDASSSTPPPTGAAQPEDSIPDEVEETPQAGTADEEAAFADMERKMREYVRAGGQGAPDPEGEPPPPPPPGMGGPTGPQQPGTPPNQAPFNPPPQEERGFHGLDEYERMCRLPYSMDTFKFAGNSITMRTLTQKEELEVLERVARYPSTARDRAFQIYTVAIALCYVNNKPFFDRLMLGPNDDDLEERFKKVLDDFYPIHIDYFFNEHSRIRREADEKAIYAGKE